MRAAVLHDFNKLAVEEVPDPVPGAGEVVVRIRACGVCATDWKAVRGVRRNVRFPFIAGHEAAGVVTAAGPGVTHVKTGDAVICQPSGYCGVCRHCMSGNTHYCEQAFTTGGDGPDEVWPGAFAELMKTRATCCLHKPAAVSFDAACLTEPLSGAWKGLIACSEMTVGDDVVVIGTGGIGLLCVMVARAAGAGRLIAVDPSAYARGHALELGATHAVDPVAGDPVKAVYAILPHGPDLVVEAAGPIRAVELARDLRRRGTRWNVFGITTPETFSLEGGRTHFLEGRMDASFGTTPRAMLKAIRLMEAGLVNPEKIISHRFPLDRIGDAMQVMDGPDRNKVVVYP